MTHQTHRRVLQKEKIENETNIGTSSQNVLLEDAQSRKKTFHIRETIRLQDQIKTKRSTSQTRKRVFLNRKKSTVNNCVKICQTR